VIPKNGHPFYLLRLLCVLLTDFKTIRQFCSEGNLQENSTHISNFILMRGI